MTTRTISITTRLTTQSTERGETSRTADSTSRTRLTNHTQTITENMAPIRRSALLILAFAFVIGLFHQPAIAKTEYRSISWAWCIWDCEYTGDYKSSDEVLAAWNAAIDQDYNQCMASARGAECGGGCYKNNYYGATMMSPGNTTILNGQPNWLITTSGQSTSYSPSCNGQPSRTTTTANNGGIATYGKNQCPGSGGWSAAGANFTSVDGLPGYTTSNVGQISKYDLWCHREIPDCPTCNKARPTFGDPIDPVGLTQTESETDYTSKDGLLSVRRHYTSAGGGRWTWGDMGIGLADFTGRSTASPAAAVGLTGIVQMVPPGYYPSGLPARVATPRSFPLLKTQPDTGQQEAWVFLANGTRSAFTETSPGVFTTNAVDKPTLTVGTSSGGAVQWKLKTQGGGFHVFDATGALVQRMFIDGKTVGYSTVGNTTTVSTLPGGRAITYARDPASGQYASATLPNGQKINYAVDQFSAINTVTYPDSSVKTYVYDESTNTGTTNSAPVLLTGIVDENGARNATFTYSGGATALSTERAGGVDKYSIPYSSDAANGYAILLMPIGTSQGVLNWDAGPDGERRLLTQSQPAGSGSAGATKTNSYEVNGNVASQDDFNGSRVCYANDLTRNLETTRVEGLTGVSCSTYTVANAALPTGSRKVSTTWHPDWRLQTKVAEPGRLTTSVYNGQPDPFNANALASCAPSTALLPDGKPIAVLCKQVQQATTDVDGHLGFTAALQSGVANRVQQWTYNQYGQVLTAKDPLNNTTSYAYYTDTSFTGTDPNAVGHTIGDLQTMTNAKSQVTTYSQYDKHGNLLQMSDPNGVVTTNTYDLRQRLLSTSVGGQTTSYSYDPAGQLLKVTAPDASWLGYEYDPAHRLTATKDNLGNRIEYTLDNAGNRTAENVKDTSGALRRQLARSIDALGRTQQTMGRE